jgi:hypothetical protein
MHCNRVRARARDPRNRSPVEVLMQLVGCRTLSIRARPISSTCSAADPTWKAQDVLFNFTDSLARSRLLICCF